MANFSFKDALLKENNVTANDITYSYEEVINLINTKNIIPKKVYPSILHDYLDEQNGEICKILNDLKERYCIEGFMNEMSYMDVFDMMFEHTFVEEINNETDENEQFPEDEDNNYSY